MPHSSVFQHFKNVAIFGSADISEHTLLYHQAFRIAKELAEQGMRIINGGGPGVMLGATAGAAAGGGTSLTVSFNPVDAPYFERHDSTNRADEDIMATTYAERLNLLITHSDAFVILRGGTGTLSEWATVWLMAHIYYGQHKPFVLVGQFWHDIMQPINENMFIGTEEKNVYEIVDTIDQVIPALQRLENKKLQLQKPAVVDGV